MCYDARRQSRHREKDWQSCYTEFALVCGSELNDLLFGPNESAALAKNNDS